MSAGIDILSKNFLSTLPNHIGIHVTVFFVLFVAISAVWAFPKKLGQNIVTVLTAIASAGLAFLFCGFIYDTLLQYDTVKNGVSSILDAFPELANSEAGILAVSKYVVSLIAVPIMFLLMNGIINLVFKISLAIRRNNGLSDNLKKLRKVFWIVQFVVRIAVPFLPNILITVFGSNGEGTAMQGTFGMLLRIYSDWKLIPLTIAKVVSVIGTIAEILITIFLRIFKPKDLDADYEGRNVMKDPKSYIGFLLGAVNGLVVFLMIFFPFFSLANSAVEAVRVIPNDAVVCYENLRDTDSEADDIIGKVFSYTVEAKRYADSYSKTFLPGLYRNCGVYDMHCKIAPVSSLETILKTTVVLGSYYYCDKNQTEISDADAVLADTLYSVIKDDEFHDVLQALFCEVVSRAASGEEARNELRQSLSESMHLVTVTSISESEQIEESKKLAAVYKALSKVLVIWNKTDEIGIPVESLVPLGHMMDSMRNTHSFCDCVEAILVAISKDEKIGKFVDPEKAISNVNFGEYTYAEYMDIVVSKMNWQ